jgi:hypothetical protein
MARVRRRQEENFRPFASFRSHGEPQFVVVDIAPSRPPMSESRKMKPTRKS